MNTEKQPTAPTLSAGEAVVDIIERGPSPAVHRTARWTVPPSDIRPYELYHPSEVESLRARADAWQAMARELADALEYALSNGTAFRMGEFMVLLQRYRAAIDAAQRKEGV